MEGQLDTMRAVERAATKVARASDSLSAALLAAHEQGATYEALSSLTGWDRRTVARVIAKLAEQYGFEAREVRPGQVDFVLIDRASGITVNIELKGGK